MPLQDTKKLKNIKTLNKNDVLYTDDNSWFHFKHADRAIDIDSNDITINCKNATINAENVKIEATAQVDVIAPIINQTATTSINLTAPNINLTGILAIAGAITAGASGGGPTTMEIEGDVKVDGPIETTGEVSSDVDVKAGSISLSTHTHGGVTPGGGSTGAPQ